MAVVNPFRGVRYVPGRIGEVRDVLSPPYDVISPAQQEALYARSPWNVVRLILPRETDRGAAAATALRHWLDAGVLAQDEEPALYFYSQRYTLPDGSAHERDGILCRLGLEEFATGVVRPHERTFPGPKADRLALLRATGAYLSPIFGLFSRPGERLRDVAGIAGAPDVEAAMDDGTVNRLWRVTDPAAIARVQAALANETIYIADGHHRYETALNWRREGGGHGGVLAFLSNMDEAGLVVLPTHRLVTVPLPMGGDALVARLGETFAVAPLDAASPARPSGAIDLVLPDRRVRLRPTPAATALLGNLPEAVRGLDVAVLHGAILGPVLGVTPGDLAFTHDDVEAIAAVAAGQAHAAFLLNPPSVAAVRAVCLAGELMPEKSTYFYPKLADGLVFDLVAPIC